MKLVDTMCVLEDRVQVFLLWNGKVVPDPKGDRERRVRRTFQTFRRHVPTVNVRPEHVVCGAYPSPVAADSQEPQPIVIQRAAVWRDG